MVRYTASGRFFKDSYSKDFSEDFKWISHELIVQVQFFSDVSENLFREATKELLKRDSREKCFEAKVGWFSV